MMQRQMSTARVALAVALSVATAAGGFAQQTSAPAATLVPAETPPPPGAFDLGLDDLSGPWPDHFLLLNDFWLPDMAIALDGVPTTWDAARGPAPRQLLGLRSFGLAMRIGEEVGPDGKHRLVFAPLYRRWDDLSGWEKFGLTLQYAGAAAAVGHFVGKLVH